jgi:hypothetical protein
MYLETIDKRKNALLRTSRNPEDEPDGTDIEEIYICDDCGRHLVVGREPIIYDPLSNEHLCGICLQDAIKIMKEEGMSQKEIDKNLIEVC